MSSVTKNSASLFLGVAKAIELLSLNLDYKCLKGMDFVGLIHIKPSIAPLQRDLGTASFCV